MSQQTPKENPSKPLGPARPAKPGEALLRVGQLARASGKTVRALHLYEEMGLLRPVHRSKGGFRLYAQSAVDRVQWIVRLQDAELSLAEIKEFLGDLEEERVATEAAKRVRALFEEKLAEIRAQRAKLERLETDLLAGLAYLDSCKQCEPEHTTSECGGCRLHGHDGSQPLLVAGIHHG